MRACDSEATNGEGAVTQIVSAEALQLAAKLLSPALTGSAADGRILVVTRDGQVDLSTYGPESTLTLTVPVEGGDGAEVEAIVQGRILVDFISAADATSAEIDTRDGRFVLDCGDDNLGVQCYPAGSWHAAAHIDASRTTWPADAPKQLARVTHAASTASSKPALRGVALVDGWAVATDGQRLAAVRLPLALDEQIIVPASALATLERLHGGDSPVGVATDGQRLTFEGSTWKVTTTLLADEFPDWQAVIPKQTKPAMVTYRDQLLTALKKIRVVAGKDDLKKVHIEQHDDDYLRIWAELPDVGKQHGLAQGRIAHPLVAFNLAHLTNAVIHMVKDTVEIEMATPHEPAVMRCDGYLALVMPIRP